jgi:hypothetical protein
LPAFIGPERHGGPQRIVEHRRFIRRVAYLIFIGLLLVAVHAFLDERLLSRYFIEGAARLLNVTFGMIGAVGEAALVAGLLALTVDMYLKRRLMQEITQDASTFFLSMGLPRELQEEVDALCREYAVRTELELNYTFTEFEGDSDMVMMSVLFSFNVVNLTADPQPFDHIASVQLAPNALRNEVVLIPEAGAKNVFEENGAPADYVEQGQPDLGDVVNGKYRVWRKRVYIPPRGSEQAAFFWSYRRQILPREFQDTFIFTHAAIRPRLQVSCPDWMDVSATFGHRLTADSFTSGNPKFWILPGGMPPYASVSIEWRKKGKQATVTPPAGLDQMSAASSTNQDIDP